MDILTLLKANIRYRKGSFISVLILTFIISLCLTTIISMNYNIDKRAAYSLDFNKTGDLTSIIWDARCTDSMLQKVRDDKDVERVRIVKTITQPLEIKGLKKGSSTFFMPYNQENNTYRIFNRDGLSFQSKPVQLGQGEIYVPISFERLYNCNIGDKAKLTDGKFVKIFTIKGFFEEPFAGCEIVGIKLALMNEGDFNALYSERMLTQRKRDKNTNGIMGYYLVNLYQGKDSHKTISEWKRDINNSTGLIDYALFTISKDQSKSYSQMFTQIISGIWLFFLILLFIVVLIVVGHSISTGIEMDYTNLGVLKAVGFHKGMLRQVFVLEYCLSEIIGAILGILGSIPAIYYLNGIFVRMTGLLSSVKPMYGICSLIMLAILLLSSGYILIKTRAIVKVSPIRAISGGRDNIYFQSRLELPVEGRVISVKMALRQVTSNLKQYLSSTIIVAILVYFLVTITLLGTAMNEKTIQDSFGVTYCDIEVGYNPNYDKSREDITTLQRQVEENISKISPIKSSFKVNGNYFTVNGDEYQGSIYDDPTMIKSILKGRAPLYDNEIVVTEIVAKELGVKMGDTVTLGNLKMEGKYIISGYFQCTNDMGRTIALSYKAAKKIMPNYYMDYVDYVITNPAKSGNIVQMLKSKYKDKIDTVDVNSEDDFGDTIINAMSIMNIVIYTISVLFAFVVIIIVCGKIFLKERMDYGIYKAIGFTSSALRLQFALRFAIIALVGSLLGIGINLGLNNLMMSSLLTGIGITSFTSHYNLISIVLPIIVMVTCFFVFAYFISGKIKRVDTKNLISNS